MTTTNNASNITPWDAVSPFQAAIIRRVDRLWNDTPAGSMLDLRPWSRLVQQELDSFPEHGVPARVPAATDQVHADLRYAALALACDLRELNRRFADEPADWRWQWAVDRRPRLEFTKPAD